MSDDDSWENYETGPFCRHWGDPADCEIKCATCGHGCTQHRLDNGETNCEECECKAWVDPPIAEQFHPKCHSQDGNRG